MSNNPIYYSNNVKTIKSIDFTIYCNKNVKIYSAVSDDPVGIDLAESYENFDPKKGGLVDLRLGTCDIYLACTTCGENSLNCPGHFGHTQLSEPVFHFGFLNHVKNILQCVCLECSNLLINKKDSLSSKILNKKPEIRFKETKLITKNINTCSYCGVIIPKIKKEIKDNGTIKIIVERIVIPPAIPNVQKNKTKQSIDDNSIVKKIKESLSPRDCYNILRNISDIDCYYLGLNPKIQRPDDLIIDILPIAPVIIRPTAKVDFMSSATMEDGITLKYGDIITANKRVKQQMEKEVIVNELSTYKQDIYNLLQYHVATLFDNESVNLPRTEFKTGGRTTKSISGSIKGKAGLVRNNIMGKRVDFSARTVITSDPYIDIDQVGVPKKIAMELTIPEEVTPYNIKYLSGLVKNGKHIYPGANFILRITYRDGKPEVQKIDLNYLKLELKLKLGDIVERHCINDDYVLFNRQPTLHKPSMMGHKIQVIDNDSLNTFRLNVSVCKPYNADFDGDEMNLHLAQSIQARNEIKRIANVRFQIVSVKDSNPIIGCQQDALSGAYMLTEPSVRIIGWEAANILSNTTSESKYELLMNKEYTGHEIFSHIIPKGINNIKKNNGNIILEITNGQLISGYLDKSSLSFAKNSIIHFIWDKYGPDKTRKFIDDSQRLILNYLILRGQSVGFGDTIIDDKIQNQIQQIISNELLESRYNITQYENDVDQLPLEIIEEDLSKHMNNVQAKITQIVMQNLDKNNFFLLAATSGAKGTPVNVAQICGVIGQTMIEGSRIKKKIESRSLIYFHQNDDTPEARGFINSSYLSGLRGYEFFINMAAGREGLIDSAIKTAQTGYIQRQLIKGLEDLIIRYDGTNRNAKGIIIQLVYGENGLNQAVQTELLFNIINMNNEAIKTQLSFNDIQIKKISTDIKIKISDLEFLNNKFTEKLKFFRDKFREIQTKSLINYKIVEEKFMVPVNLFRITQDYTNKKKIDIIDLNPSYILNQIEDFLDDYDNRLITILNKTDKMLKKDDREMKFLLELSLYEYLAPVKCIFHYNLNKETFDKLMKEIKMNYIKALIEPGEMVGIIAAQSIGEPTSQLTLNTKHSAGAKSSSNKGLGRIQEILHYSKNIKVPQMIIYFNPEYKKDKNMLNKITSGFTHLSIRQLIISSEIYYDLGLNDKLSNVLKNDNVSNPFYINNQSVDINSLPFVIRITLDIEKMVNKETTLLDIKTKFIYHWNKYYTNIKIQKKNEKEVISKISKCAILSNTITANEPIIHIRFNMISFNNNLIIEFIRMILDDITLKGIENIDSITIEEEMKIDFDKNTGNIIKSDEPVIYTLGINFEKLRFIKGIDFTRTTTNDIATILKLYGIEAARQIILNELAGAFIAGGTKVNQAHLSVLVDQMCYLGEIISMDRHGISKIDLDPIARASFEKTMDHFVNAAIFNESDTMNSVSSRIAIGRVIPGGTGAFDLLLDTNKIENSEYIENETAGRIYFNQLEEDALFSDIINHGLGKTKFYIPN